MKAIILASEPGQIATITNFVPKALVPVAKIPLIAYNLRKLKSAGVKEIAIVCLKRDLDRFKIILGMGSIYGVDITYYTEETFTDHVTSIEASKGFLEDNDLSFILPGDLMIETKFTGTKGSPQIWVKNTNEEEAKKHITTLIDKKNFVEGLEEKSDEPYSYSVFTGLGFFTSGRLVYEVCGEVKPNEEGKRSLVEYLNIFCGKTKLKANEVTGYFSRLLNEKEYSATNLWAVGKVFSE